MLLSRFSLGLRGFALPFFDVIFDFILDVFNFDTTVIYTPLFYDNFLDNMRGSGGEPAAHSQNAWSRVRAHA